MNRICCDLPEEVLVEIFSWLPPESLIRFKCVSKSFYAVIKSLIKNPEFVNKHLHNIDNNILSSTCLVLCHYEHFFSYQDPELEFPWCYQLKLLTISNDDFESDLINCDGEDFYFPTFPKPLTVIGHYNGIICLIADHNRKVILFNPAIKECRTLPKPCLSFPFGFTPQELGFAYDSRANDYKVVRFGTIDHRYRAEIYSMRADSWREIGFHLEEFGFYPVIDNGVFCKGVFYWSIWDHKYIIISFDMFDEIFHSISLPNNLLATATEEKRIKLAVWNESLALFSYPVESEPSNSSTWVPKSIKVWVMDDYASGVKGSCSWIKKLSIRPLLEIEKPLAFLTNDDLVLETNDGDLILYSLHNQQLRFLTFKPQLMVRWRWDFSYVKTLVSVRGGNQSHS